MPQAEPARAAPIVFGAVTVRGVTWRGVGAIDAERDAITWEHVATTAARVAERAAADFRARGLPRPKVGAWRWRGGWVQPHEPVVSGRTPGHLPMTRGS